MCILYCLGGWTSPRGQYMDEWEHRRRGRGSGDCGSKAERCQEPYQIHAPISSSKQPRTTSAASVALFIPQLFPPVYTPHDSPVGKRDEMETSMWFRIDWSTSPFSCARTEMHTASPKENGCRPPSFPPNLSRLPGVTSFST